MNTPVPALPEAEEIRAAILHVRKTRVVLAEDLARFYGKSVSAFNQAVKRRADLFDGYRFQLTDAETVDLESRSVISKPQGRGGLRVARWVYTDYGVVIASTLFRDPRATAITRMMTEAFVDAANTVVVMPPEAERPVAFRREDRMPTTEDLRILAEQIMKSGEQGFLDLTRTPTTKRQQAVAATMLTLAETAGREIEAREKALRLAIAERLAAGDVTGDGHRRDLLDLLRALQGS